jgi:hypothetical protein
MRMVICLQTEIHRAEPIVPGHSHLEAEIVTAKLKKYKSLGGEQISTKVIQAGGEILISAIHRLSKEWRLLGCYTVWLL